MEVDSAIMSFLKRHKSAIQNKFTSLLISGYLRKQEIVNNLRAIPALIVHIIIIFYHITEHFTTPTNNNFITSNDQLTIINTKDYHSTFDPHSTVYLNEQIQSLSNKIITWTFRIDKLKGAMSIGLISNKIISSPFSKQQQMIAFVQQLAQFPALFRYLQGNPQELAHLLPGFRLKQQLMSNRPLSYVFENDMPCLEYPNGASKQNSDIRYNEGDIVAFTLDLINKKVYCAINNGTESILVEDVETGEGVDWRMVMGLKHIGDSVSILNCYEHA